jgi:SAM-dependent methyltransferase
VRDPAVRAAWEAEYRAGRYVGEAPVPFIDEILAESRKRGVRRGLYIGCGNGRNFVPLSRGGLQLDGLDLSPTAIAQLAARFPECADRLTVGEVDALPARRRYPLVLGLQVFQHGDRETCHAHVAAAQRRVATGGLFALRVNAVGTEVEHAHEVVEGDAERGFTVRYRSGPKRGLRIHFFGRPELEECFRPAFVPVVPLRRVTEARASPATGTWIQWEGIWERRALSAHVGPSAPAGTVETGTGAAP